MVTQDNIVDQVQKILAERSDKSIELAKQAVLEEQIKYEPLGKALRYFMEEVWVHVSHPALLSLTCEAVGGNPDDTIGLGAALVLLAGAADIHDDIIDQSITKGGKPTVFGKYGEDIAIISGDVLWFKGMLMLNKACEQFPSDKAKVILELAKQAFFDLGSAEGKETSHHGDLGLSPEEYLNVVKLKVSLAQATAKIGVIIGGGTSLETANMGEYGKFLGLLMTIRDEYIDVFELEELKNRYKNECLPLPVLYALQNSSLNEKIIEMLEKEELNESEMELFVETVLNSPEVRKLHDYVLLFVKEATDKLSFVSVNKDLFLKLLKFTLEGLFT